MGRGQPSNGPIELTVGMPNQTPHRTADTPKAKLQEQSPLIVFASANGHAQVHIVILPALGKAPREQTRPSKPNIVSRRRAKHHSGAASLSAKLH
jgi:hypothetical protein